MATVGDSHGDSYNSEGEQRITISPPTQDKTHTRDRREDEYTHLNYIEEKIKFPFPLMCPRSPR